ncbi:hypothetical protein [Desertibaculum subflavum]|uniref:hypothetical protein n=1 Tax=Desertibaculum subflavum TaxID=2268458 RepID=UPI000E667E13
MRSPINLLAAALALGLGLVAPAQARNDKAIDCAKAENAKRSECANALGQTKENQRTNKGGAATGADRSGTMQDLNAAREKKGGGKKN